MRRRLGIAAVASIAAVVALAATGAAGCGDDAPAARALDARERAVLARAFERASADSVALARARFSVAVELETSIAGDESSVRVQERFRLVKSAGATFSVVDRTQQIRGDRKLLGSMYSFENSKGELRSETEARLSSVGFGADGRRILDDLLDGRLALARPIADSTWQTGRRVLLVGFAGTGRSGELVLDSATAAVLGVTDRETSSSLIGGYDYTMSLVWSDPSGQPRLPLAMRTRFRYERLMSSGSGAVRMRIDTTGLRVSTTQ